MAQNKAADISLAWFSGAIVSRRVGCYVNHICKYSMRYSIVMAFLAHDMTDTYALNATHCLISFLVFKWLQKEIQFSQFFFNFSKFNQRG